MQPEMILQADVLDIIFDNRNKEYGAYELRCHYERRLKKSLWIMFLFLAVLVLGYYWLNQWPNNTVHTNSFSPGTVSLTQVSLDRPAIQPKIIGQQQQHVAKIKNTSLRIVPDEAATISPPTNSQLDMNQTGAETKPSDLNAGMTQSLPDGNAKGSRETARTVAEKEEIVEAADVMPEFPGGQDALMRFLVKNLKMPREDMEPGSRVATLVRFVVDKDGAIAGIEFEKSGGRDFDNEVMRVIRKMPHWSPGKLNGKNVAVYFKLPVIFTVPVEN